MRASTVETFGMQRMAHRAARRPCALFAERDDARDAGRLGGRGELRKLAVVAIEHGGAARLEPEEDLRLGVGDLFQRAEIFQMHRRDRGDDRHMRAHQLGERRDLAGMVHADLEHARIWRSPDKRASDSGTPQ